MAGTHLALLAGQWAVVTAMDVLHVLQESKQTCSVPPVLCPCALLASGLCATFLPFFPPLQTQISALQQGADLPQLGATKGEGRGPKGTVAAESYPLARAAVKQPCVGAPCMGVWATIRHG